MLGRGADGGQISQLLQAVEKLRFSFKKRSAFLTGAKIYLSEKIFWGLVQFNNSYTDASL